MISIVLGNAFGRVVIVKVSQIDPGCVYSRVH